MTDDPSSTRTNLTLSRIVGLGIALFGIPLLWPLDLPSRIGTSTAASMLVGSLTNWVVVTGLMVVVVFWERRPFASVGLRLPGRREALGGILVGLVAVVIGLLVTGIAVIGFGLEQPETLSSITRLSLPVQLALVLTGVVTEELLWRGYPIERLTELTGRPWIGGLVSGVVFLAVHFPAWGLVGAIPQAIFTLALVVLYVRGRNVVTCMLAHAVINALMILVLPSFL